MTYRLPAVGLQLAPIAGVKARLMSLGIHASAIALLILISSHPAIRPGAPYAIDLLHARVARLLAPKAYRGGGGGGQHELLPASRGTLPKFAPHQFTPPSARPPEVQAIVMMEPTLIGPPDVKPPEVDLARLGDPLGRDGPESNGPGKGGGIGDGGNGGLGGRNGPGYGDEDGGGISVTGFTGNITAPLVLYKVEPEFSEEARKAKYQEPCLWPSKSARTGNRIVCGFCAAWASASTRRPSKPFHVGYSSRRSAMGAPSARPRRSKSTSACCNDEGLSTRRSSSGTEP